MILNILETNGRVLKTAENIKYLTTDQKVSGLNPDGVTSTTHSLCGFFVSGPDEFRKGALSKCDFL